MAGVSAFRRARAEVFITSAAILAVALALVLLASGPIFADAVSTGALRRSLTDAPASDQAVLISGRIPRSQVADTDAIVRNAVRSASESIDVEVVQSIEASVAYGVPDQPSENRTDIVRLGWLDDAESHVSLVAGQWPDERGPANAIEVAVDADAARTFGLALGRELPLVTRSPSAERLDIVVVGHLRIDDPFDAYWQGRERTVEPVTVSPAFRTVSLFADRDLLLDSVVTRPEVEWLVLPRFDDIELQEVDQLRTRIGNLESEINGRLFDPNTDTPIEISVRTRLPELLRDDRTLTVARAVIFATVAQLSTLAAFALTLVAGLGVDARRSESALLRARGAGPAQLTGQATVDAAFIVVPVAAAAPLLATVVVGWFDEFGPLASIDLVLAPRPVAAAWWTTAAATIVAIGLLVLPAARAAAAAASEGASSRPRLVGPIQRTGIDLAILGAAVFAYWQLRVLGDDQAAVLRGRFGVDPLVVVAPLFGIVAGALLVLRLLPLAARIAERLTAKSSGATGALTVWQLARRPDRYNRTALLVTMAVAVGTYASVYETTWSESQRAQAAHQVGADIRVEPNRRVGASIGSLQRTSLLQSVPGVEAVMAAVSLDTTLAGDARPGRLLALDAAAAGAVDISATSAAVDALDRLVRHRPEIPGIGLPGAPIELHIESSVTEVDQSGVPVEPNPDEPSLAPVAGSLTLTLQDADGLLHVVNAGSLAADSPVRSISLAATDISAAAVPRAPLQIVDLRLDTVTQGALAHIVEITLGPLHVVDGDGTTQHVPLSGVPFTISTEPQGFLSNPASGTVSSNPTEGSMTITINTGSSLQAVRVIHTVGRTQRPDSEVLAGVADRRWAARADVSLGQIVGVPTDRIADLRVEITDLVDVIPGVDPNTTPAIIVDLPSMQWHERTGGQPTREISDYWLRADPAAGLDVDTFLRSPVEAVQVVVLEDRRAELTSSPPALGSLGALGAGFFASVVLAMTALVLTAVVSVRERAAEFAILDALGLSRRRRRAWLFREQAIIVTFGAAIGTIIGLVLAHLVLPVTTFSQSGGSTFPPVEVIVPWTRVLTLALVVGTTSLAAVGIALALRARTSTGTALRTGVGQ